MLKIECLMPLPVFVAGAHSTANEMFCELDNLALMIEKGEHDSEGSVHDLYLT